MSDNIHKGHRQRVRNDFLNGAFSDETPDYKWLELLLFYCIPQKDTNEIAHELINKFGSVAGVFDAPVEELVKTKYLSENSAVLLKLIVPLMRRYELEKSRSLFELTSRDDVDKYIAKQFYGLNVERIGVFLLHPTGRIIDFKFLSEGDFCQVGISTREIVKFALEKNSQMLIIAHNHPGGFALPSREDISATENLISTLKKLNIALLDHLIISGTDYVSLAESLKYSYMFN